MTNNTTSWPVMESDTDFHPDYLDNVIANKWAGYITHNFFSQELCDSVVDRFIKHPQRFQETGNNKVIKEHLQTKGPILLRRKDYKSYFENAAENQEMFYSVYDGFENPMEKLISLIKNHYAA
ncbi:MAG: hypothetical protein M3Q44_02705 [bacterium]|nr:hypothetical protein [bacterium]